MSWTKVGTSGLAAVVMLWVIASAVGTHGGNSKAATALGNAIGSSSFRSASSANESTAVPSSAAMPVVPGLAQAAIRRPASVSYATVAWVGRAAPHVDGTAADPVALQVTAIPRRASISYQRAATVEAQDAPTCGLSWEILAGIGLVESNHGRSGGSGNPNWAGIADPAILGPVLNGQDGFPVVQDTDNGVLDGDRSFDRAVGPMQFLPATWREYNPATSGADAPNPENISDAAAAAARYLCASDVDLRTPTGLIDGLYGYNHSFAYVMNVVTAAQRYAEGTLRGAGGALAVLPALLSGQPTASFVTYPVTLPPGSTSPTPSDGSSTQGTPDTSPSTTRSAIVGLPTPDPNPTPVPDPTSAPTVDSPSDSAASSDSSDPASPSSDSPTPDSPSATSPATDSAAPSTASVSPAPDTSAPTTPDTPTPTPSLAPTPTQPTTPAPTPSPTAPGVTQRPGPTNTGVPAGTQLTVYNGDLTITTPGATYSGFDIYGFVKVEAPNVTIKDSIIRGGPATSTNSIIYDLSDAATNLLVEDSEIVPADPSVYIDGIDGWNYTALRLNIHGTVDGAKMFGTNATVQDSWIHDLVTYQHDPSHGGGISHNDDVQILSGSNLKVLGNDLEGGSNSAIQITQDHGPLTDVLIDGNWADAGSVTFNIANKPLASLAGITVTNNLFGHAAVTGCQILYTAVTTIVASNNVYADTGQPVVILNTGSTT